MAVSTSTDYKLVFGGITSHSMLLAPCCGITLIESLWKILYGNLTKKQLLIQYGLIVIAMWTLLVAGSRGALIASALSIAVLFYYFPFKKKLFKYLAFIIVLAPLVPKSVYENATYTIDKKNSYAESKNSLTASRDARWEARLMEFKENPILGVGFASQTHFTSGEDLEQIKKTGGLESGSSWLSILSMTGLLGFVMIAIFNMKLLSHLIKAIKHTPLHILHLSMLIFFIIHGIVEAWMLYSGGFIFYLYWLLTGNVNNVDRMIEEKSQVS